MIKDAAVVIYHRPNLEIWCPAAECILNKILLRRIEGLLRGGGVGGRGVGIVVHLPW
jgi:hypothetical protein